MKTEKPAAPEGCVYEPWFNPMATNPSQEWLCYKKNEYGQFILCRWASVGSERVWRWIIFTTSNEPSVPELLRLAAQRDRLVEGLERSLQALNDQASMVAMDQQGHTRSADRLDDQVAEFRALAKSLIKEVKGELNG